MVNYACAFSQSESGKHFQWIIIPVNLFRTQVLQFFLAILHSFSKLSTVIYFLQIILYRIKTKVSYFTLFSAFGFEIVCSRYNEFSETGSNQNTWNHIYTWSARLQTATLCEVFLITIRLDWREVQYKNKLQIQVHVAVTYLTSFSWFCQ